MGGTSTDVAPVLGGQVQTTTESVIAGGADQAADGRRAHGERRGGSIAWVDDGGALRVGPHSAGADPGPAAYGKGGEEPTVTDANLYLGHLADGAEPEAVTLDRGKAEEALHRVGERLGLDAHETARGIVRVADAEMTRALRVISVERGLDPRDFTLVAFGGAGAMHACALAEELGVARVLVPKACGVLSALGLAISDVRRDAVRPFLADLHDVDEAKLAEVFEAMEGDARGALARTEGAEGDPELTREADLRYKGQSFELTVPADDLDELAGRFHAAHERRYGWRRDDAGVEVVNLRLTATLPGIRPTLREDPAGGKAEPARREISVDGEWREVDVLDRSALGAGSKVEGPAVVEFAEATCVVRLGWSGAIDEVGTLVLERGE